MKPPSPWRRPTVAAAVLAGAALGAASGPVAACELSAALASGFGACVPAGAGAGALTGALLGLAAAPLCRDGSSCRRPAGHRPARSTLAAAWLVVAAVVAMAWAWTAEWAASGERAGSGEGLEQLLLLLVGVTAAIVGAVLLVLALGLLRRRGWARWAAVVGFSLAAVAALSALLATVKVVLEPDVAGAPGANPPPAELAPPAAALAVSVAVVVLVLLPATARDFRATGPPPRAAGS
jgi:hypothetical protein